MQTNRTLLTGVLVVAIGLLGGAVALAQQSGVGAVPQSQPQPQQEKARPTPPQNPNLSLDPVISPDPLQPVLQPWYDLKAKADTELSLKITPGYTFVYQYATDTVDGPPQGLDGRFDLGADWTLLHTGPKDTGSLGFLFRSQENIGHSQEFNLSPGVGDAFGTNSVAGRGEQQPAAVYLLYWRQSFFDNRLAVYAGKLHPNQYMDLSSVANDETTQFLAGPFDGNPTNPLEGAYTPGAAVEYQATPTVHINGMVVSSAGLPQTAFQGWHKDNFYEAVEIGWQPTLANLGKGNYRLFGWHDEFEGSQGYGLGVLLEQEVGGGWVPFVRWGYGNPEVASFEQSVAGGIANTRPFGRRGDMFGLAGVWGTPSSEDLRQETLIEMFYRLQLTNSLQISPDVELLVPPASRDANDVVAIFGIRLKVLF